MVNAADNTSVNTTTGTYTGTFGYTTAVLYCYSDGYQTPVGIVCYDRGPDGDSAVDAIDHFTNAEHKCCLFPHYGTVLIL